ncbi:V-type proton ATPase subunit S1 [Drosophila novamexicana]|uniref:V-type proton ATPase subunit S1 n=1 Tax=Drosophila novamexicana TaxID=47314 RepID=UPI0011E5FE7A|nr:V-type proton ATPase subunit S1 [Drosophila novamexicana]
MKIIVISLLLLAFGSCTHFPTTPPVLILGVSLPDARNIFQALESDYFTGLLRPLLQEHMLVVYFESALTPKDLSCVGCFPYLRGVQPRTYYSQVHDPFASVEMLFTERGEEMIWNRRRAMLTLPCQRNSIQLYNFKNSNLTAHDKFMKAVALNLEDCPVIHLYTAHAEQMKALQRRLQRVNDIMKWMKPTATTTTTTEKPKFRGQTSQEHVLRNGSKQSPSIVVLRHPRGIVALDKIVFAEEIPKGLNVYYKRFHIYPSGQSSLSLKLKDNTNIKKGVNFFIDTSLGPLKIKLAPVVGCWRIPKLIFQNTTFIPRDLLFYGKRFSFCCYALTAYSDDGARLTLYSFSMDVVLADNISAMDPDYMPKACWLCEEYLTPALTQAIFTVCILLFLLGLGLTMFLEMGRNMRMPNIREPEPPLKVPVER